MFTAHNVTVSEDEDCWTVGLVDNVDNPNHYLIIQRGRGFDSQDHLLGMDKVYFEFDDQSRSFYGGVTHIKLSKSQLMLRIDPQIALSRGLPTEAAIELMVSQAEWEHLRDTLNLLAQPFLTFDQDQKLGSV